MSARKKSSKPAPEGPAVYTGQDYWDQFHHGSARSYEHLDTHSNYSGREAGSGKRGTTSKAKYAPLAPAPFAWHPTGAPRVFAGRQLLEPEDAERLVRETGATHVLDLRQPHEWQKPKRGEAAIARLEALGVRRMNVPVRDMSAPEPKDFQAALDFLQEGYAEGGTLYIHCRAGKERTAAVLLVFLAHLLNTEGLQAAPNPLSVVTAWNSLVHGYKTFLPLASQARAAIKFLKVEGLLPCTDCGLPLEVGTGVARATCVHCDTRWQRQAERSKPRSWNPGEAYGPLDGWSRPAPEQPTLDLGTMPRELELQLIRDTINREKGAPEDLEARRGVLNQRIAIIEARMEKVAELLKAMVSARGSAGRKVYERELADLDERWHELEGELDYLDEQELEAGRSDWDPDTLDAWARAQEAGDPESVVLCSQCAEKPQDPECPHGFCAACQSEFKRATGT